MTLGEEQAVCSYEYYRQQMPDFYATSRSFRDSWKEIVDWYQSDVGRSLFIKTFRHETGIKVNPSSNFDTRIETALAKSWGDDSKKIQTDYYYKAHAEMFVTEMDELLARVPKCCEDAEAEIRFGNVVRFVRRVLMDHLVLFEHWGTRRAEVPGVFGVVRNEWTHPVNFYHGAKQIIYGHGSFRLTFSDNHSEIAVATVRQALEVRLRGAFGFIGKESKDNAFHPVPLSMLLEVLSRNKTEIDTPIPIHNLVRINNWANLLLHSGVREYAWTLPRVLDYLRSWLVGGDKAGASWTVDSGIRVSKKAFDEIQNEVREQIEGTGADGIQPPFKAILLDASECAVVISEDAA